METSNLSPIGHIIVFQS